MLISKNISHTLAAVLEKTAGEKAAAEAQRVARAAVRSILPIVLAIRDL
jgi:hypothetical protein